MTNEQREQEFRISIHAPRAGRDKVNTDIWELSERISIHAPRAGRDRDHTKTIYQELQFQSTRPVRGATAQK